MRPPRTSSATASWSASSALPASSPSGSADFCVSVGTAAALPGSEAYGEEHAWHVEAGIKSTLAAGKIAGLESYRVGDAPQLGRYPKANELPVTDKVLEAFRDFARRDEVAVER